MSIPPDWLILAFDRRVLAPPSAAVFLCAKRRTPEGVLYITTERSRRIRHINQTEQSGLQSRSGFPFALQFPETDVASHLLYQNHKKFESI